MPSNTKPNKSQASGSIFGSLSLPYVSWPRRWSFQNVLARALSWWRAIYTSRWLLGLLLLLGLALRLAGLGNDALWYDEVFTSRLASLDLLSLAGATRGDVHPPLWYLIEWLAVRLIGNEPTGLRLPAALFGTWSIYEMYRLVKLVIGEHHARSAAIAVTILPAAINYSQEARQYALFALLVIANLRAVLENKWGRAWMLAALLAYLHNVALLYVGCIAFLLYLRNPYQAWRLVWRAGVAYAPWALSLASQLQTVGEKFWPIPPTPGALVTALIYNTLYIRYPGETVIPIVSAGIAISGAAAVILRKQWRILSPIVAMSAIPPLLIFAISNLWRSILVDRIMLPSGIMLAALWGIAAATLTTRSRLIALAAAAPALITALVGYYTWRNPHDLNWRPAIEAITDHDRPCDVIYHVDAGSYMLMDNTVPGRNIMTPIETDLSLGLTDETKDAMGIVRQPFDALPGRYCRAWLVDARTPMFTDKQQATVDHITATYPVLSVAHPIRDKLAEVTIYLIDLGVP